jgi:hypothetical protein
MGYQLRRMIRDGAPAEWTPLMRLVAAEIADDARDVIVPYSGEESGWPWSAIPVESGYDSAGRWREGLAERTGMSARAISRTLTELAAAKYEMRVAVGVDKNGRPVFACKGHAMRFQVPPLSPRRQSPPDPAGFEGGEQP